MAKDTCLDRANRHCMTNFAPSLPASEASRCGAASRMASLGCGFGDLLYIHVAKLHPKRHNQRHTHLNYPSHHHQFCMASIDVPRGRTMSLDIQLFTCVYETFINTANRLTHVANMFAIALHLAREVVVDK